VPAQSGCNDVLKRMKRLYTVEYYREMLQRCRERVPGVAVSSDFIVGFCGETEGSFARTCDLVREAGFKNSFIFKYSPRPGTKADELFADDVPEEVKKRRNNDLLAIQNAVSLADHRRRIGETVEVLVEGPSKTALKHDSGSGPKQLTGRTMTDHIVVFEGNERLTGRTVAVRVEGATAFTLFGTVVTGEQVGVETPRGQPPTEPLTRRLGLPLL
jgi:tRNA-2-methylthio-N6-dimethylallyladenosine synthase